MQEKPSNTVEAI
jgi:hypothetical protein